MKVLLNQSMVDAGPLKRPAVGERVEPSGEAQERYRSAVAKKYLMNKTSALETLD